MVKNNNSVIVLAALCCAVIFYARLLPLKESKPYRSLLPIEMADFLEGTVASNPVKLSSGRFYAMDFSVETASCRIRKASASSAAQGLIPVYMPSSIVESLYPGKIYTQGILVEKGERQGLFGSWDKKRQVFLVKEAVYKSYSHSPQGILCHFRAVCRLVFKRLLFSWGKAGGLLLALLSGSREYTAAEDSEAFRRAGLSHILALSGMHLSFFAGMTDGVGNIVWGRKHRLLIRLAGICFFVWFAGFSPSLFRAFLFCLLMAVLEFFHCRRIERLTVLAAVFLLHIILKPADMFSISFMLSYAALAGILCFSPLCERFFVRFLPPGIAASVSASSAAQLATAPLSIALFGSIMPVGIIASVIVSPLAGFFLSAGVAGMLLCLLLPFLAPLASFILNGIYRLCLFFVHSFALVPTFTFRSFYEN